MRLTLSSKLALICALLVVLAGGGTSFLVLYRFAATWEQQLLDSDRELAKVLAGLRDSRNQLEFNTLTSFVESSDQVNTGLVYALELDRRGVMRRGALNPRLFASLDPRFQELVLQGRRRVLQLLAKGKVDRRGKIKESTLSIPGGSLRLGFDLGRIDDQVREAFEVGLGILAATLFAGVIISFILARWMTSPVKRLAGAMDAVARGELDQTVTVSTTDELSAMASSFNKMTRSLREHTWEREHIRPYLSTGVMERILTEENALEMSFEEGAVTALALSFKRLSTLTLPAADALRLLNEYLAPIIDAIHEYKGVVTRIDDRLLLAVWGLPMPVRESELRAIKGALAARDGAHKEGRRQTAVGGIVLDPSIGISSGRAVGGNLGSSKRVEYTVLGGAVELARHVMEMAEPGEILVNEAAFSKIRDHVSGTACAPLILEGMEEAVPLYRLEGELQPAQTPEEPT